MKRIVIYILYFSLVVAQPGILNVGFDVDDTILFSRDVFLSLPDDKRDPVDYGWINSHDKEFSLFITPTVELINYFHTNGHNVFFITARPGTKGNILAEFLSYERGFSGRKNTIKGKRYTTKHRLMKRLKLDLFYGDADTDMIAALKAGVHPVRVVRHETSIVEYGSNYFGNTNKGNSAQTPFTKDDLKLFYNSNVGIFGESIYPIIWMGPK